jgi:uncharacterized membrane protein YhaH (DUF805 family)
VVLPFFFLLSWGATIAEKYMGIDYSSLVTLAFVLPLLAAGCRRLHDIGRTGWWQLLLLTGIGTIVLIVWWATSTKNEPNIYGEVPQS